MSGTGRWTSPFLKQCFAVSSVSLNMISCGLTVGFNASLFSELRKTQEIPLNIDSESWLASLSGLTIFIGAVGSSIIMETIGRKPAIVISSALMLCGWISLICASSFAVLLTGKIVQGISTGLGANVGGILIAEYCSPKYRGAFIATIPTAMLFGGFIPHAFAMFYNWHEISKILIFFSLPGFIMAVLSPESPTFLATKGRYNECRKVFRWLRGTNEDEELETMIKTAMIVREIKGNGKNSVPNLIKKKIAYIFTMFKKREFRNPVIIMVHLNAITQSCGTLIQDMYALDIHKALYGTDAYMFKVITSLDILKLISMVSAIYIVSKFKRRLMLVIFVGLNILANLSVAGYIYAREHDFLPSKNLAFGIILHHFQIFTIGAGSWPLPFIICSEIYPIEHKGLCGMISSATFSFFVFANIKSALYLFFYVGVDGAFCLHALILLYSMLVSYIMLPETKDKTLLDVENEVRGYAIDDCDEGIELNDQLKAREEN
ncbi:sugar transporter ERD6-like 4 isoform X1 [Bombyx mandarina]|uniref:Sugar transporter ERD6-like 4 isoform X1 n=1 Tax=Bombyx mandarina TaxID=7092 RepID=A0A6J2KVA5_BOMMA|nr:sugar transporter ERD6-like 4 isoform X1 [Bombyx mandarina]